MPSILSEDDASDERSATDSDSRDDNSDSGEDTDSRDDGPDSDGGQEMQRIAHANVEICTSEDLESGLNGEHFELANFMDDTGLEAAGLLELVGMEKKRRGWRDTSPKGGRQGWVLLQHQNTRDTRELGLVRPVVVCTKPR